MNYFEGCTTTEARKKRYRELAKKYHPDVCGTDKEMKVINQQYKTPITVQIDPQTYATGGTGTFYYYNGHFFVHGQEAKQSVNNDWERTMNERVAKAEALQAAHRLWMETQQRVKEQLLRDAQMRAEQNANPYTCHFRIVPEEEESKDLPLDLFSLFTFYGLRIGAILCGVHIAYRVYQILK